MSAEKENIKMLKKSSKSRASGDVAESHQSIIIPQRIFLYLQPKSITYTLGDIPSSRSEIEVQHQYNTITTLSDHYMPRNIIQIDQFDIIKPTFSVTIEQDSLENITMFSDSPILLTLYVYKNGKSQMLEGSEKSVTDEEACEDILTPVAQGHIDIIEYFNNKRTSSTVTVFLYPLENYGQILTCKTEWEIYSLHPLLKTIVFSNFLFITLDSLYNISEELMDDCQNLVANLSFISRMPNEKNDFHKIFICNFKTFSKSNISQQNLTKSWETLKNNKVGNINCMGIASDCKININQLFLNLSCTSNVEFNFSRININEDFALICNSMHRYVLTDKMQKILEDILSKNLYHIILEIYSKKDESKILLQGYVDLSIFMYPEVNNCSYAVKLESPSKAFANQSPNKDTLKSGNAKRRSKNSQDQQIKEDAIIFAIIQICLYTSITNPCQDMTTISKHKPKPNKFCQDMSTLTKIAQTSLPSNCEENYRAFDNLVLEIIDYMFNNNIKKLNDDREFFANQLNNINKQIMKLVASDFNIKTPTKTNAEFKNLITTVYRDLISRIHDCLNKCCPIGLDVCVFTMRNSNFIIKNMSLAKYLYEVGNIDMASVFMNILRSKYPNNTKLKFYIFLYDIERQNFESVKKYLKSSLDDKDTEGKLFENLVQCYINYKLQTQHFELNQTAEENLIKALSEYSMSHKPTSLTAFILLYCVYKRHNYQSGMAYCRWHYESLYDSKFIKLEFIPKSRWEMHMPHKIHLKTLKGQNFIKVCYKLLRLGLYNFAQWVFDEIADECLEIERYFFSNTFTILENKLQGNLPIKKFFLDKLPNPIQLRATLSLVNGNLEHFRHNDNPASKKYYQDIAELKDLEDYGCYQLGLLRLACKSMKEKKYDEASRVFLKLCNDEISGIVAAAERGKACYHLGQLDEAEKYFAISTEYGIYVESTWEYLALINLRKGNNFNALECWKYARLNQNIEVQEDVMSELKKINYNDVFLFVDIPSKI